MRSDEPLQVTDLRAHDCFAVTQRRHVFAIQAQQAVTTHPGVCKPPEAKQEEKVERQNDISAERLFEVRPYRRRQESDLGSTWPTRDRPFHSSTDSSSET